MTSPSTIARLAAAGVVVSAGHTNATCAQIQEALRHGATGFTHLFNAMSPLTSREPGTVGAALADPDSWCGLIVDGRHVDPLVLRIALACKRHDRFLLVTDAMPVVGSGQDHFQLQGRRITVRDGGHDRFQPGLIATARKRSLLQCRGSASAPGPVTQPAVSSPDPRGRRARRARHWL